MSDDHIVFFGKKLMSNNTFREWKDLVYVSAKKKSYTDENIFAIRPRFVTYKKISAQNTLFPLIWYQVILQASCEKKKKDVCRTERQTFESRAIEAYVYISSLVQAFLAVEAQCM